MTFIKAVHLINDTLPERGKRYAPSKSRHLCINSKCVKPRITFLSRPPVYGVPDRGHNNTVAYAMIKETIGKNNLSCFRRARERKRCVRIGGGHGVRS